MQTTYYFLDCLTSQHYHRINRESCHNHMSGTATAIQQRTQLDCSARSPPWQYLALSSSVGTVREFCPYCKDGCRQLQTSHPFQVSYQLEELTGAFLHHGLNWSKASIRIWELISCFRNSSVQSGSCTQPPLEAVKNQCK